MGTKTIQGLELAFDVGHSSIGWAVLQSVGRESPRAEAPRISILGCGVVTFGADDCLASKRRDKRRQRRHIRSTRQRIERMAKLFLCILANEKDEGLSDLLKELRIYLTNSNRAELTKAGTKKNASHPYLLAARVLAARTDEEKAKARLTWPQLWDVLRWYAHNRGYDGNIRWSGGFNVEAFSETPLASRKELDAQVEALNDNDPGDDKKKLLAAAVRMEDYGFTTPTFAETVVKFLFGPDRTVRPGGEGKPGIVEPTNAPFNEAEFRRLLFNCEPGFESHPRHLRNYFKGIRAAFPRRVIKEINDKPTLVCGTEWEVRYILRAHFDHLKHCDAALEQVLCGGIPESASDWSALKHHFPSAYISDTDIAKLSKLKVSKKLPRDQKQRLASERRKILQGKLALHARYHGGLLFGQLVPRFDNRIIEQCPFTFAAVYQAILQKDEAAVKLYKLSLSQIAASRRQVNGEEESDEAVAKRWATKLAKVPGKNCLEFLDYRWVMMLANIRIGFDGEAYRNAEGKETSLRPLNPDERLKIDAEARKRGFLKVEPDKAGKNGHMREGKNELREIVIKETKCNRHNLDALLLVPDIKEALRILPVKGSKEAFQIVWGAFDSPGHDKDTGSYSDNPLRRRFSHQLLRGKKDEPRFLTIASIIAQLQSPDVVKKHPTAPEIITRIEQAARQEASDKRGNLNEAKLTELLNAKFSCERLKGRARFGRLKLREAVQQVMHKDSPLHPLEKGGCLEQTDAIKEASIQKSMAELTNNHLVRHRLLILTGDQQNPSDKKRKHGLLDHIIQEFANGDKKLISRITVELARDLQTMSGMTNEEKAKELGGKVGHHLRVSQKLAEMLQDERDENGRPIPISPGLIRKARIADDLGFHPEHKSWECPYTGRFFTAADLFHRRFDRDHIVPRSQRLSDALEAIVITSREVNAEKGKRTALQFVKDMNRPENRAIKDRLNIRSEAQFRTFVDKLPTTGHPEDVRRKQKRKQLLLVEKWEEKEFTPGDLTKTRHLVKLAAQQLERAFHDVPKEQRPPIISINGAVTAAFRDKTWKLIRELAAVHPEVKKAADEERQAKEQGRDYNLKKKIRQITNLHHAVDAVALGLVTNLLVPFGHGSLNTDLVRLIIKVKLTAEERRRFEEMCHQFGLPKFYQWAADRCDDSEQKVPAAGAGGILCLNELPKDLKKEIQERLQEFRIVTHIAADQGTLDSDETLYRVFDPNDSHPTAQKIRRWFEKLLADGKLKKLKKLPDPNDPAETLVLLVSRKRRGTDGESSGKVLREVGKEWTWKYMLVAKNAIQGLSEKGDAGKLSVIKAAKPLGKNFGVAKISPEDGKPIFNIIRPCRAYAQLKKFKKEHPKAKIELIRRGTLIELTEEDQTITRLRIFGSGERPERGIYFDAAPPDSLERVREIQISAFKQGRAKILNPLLTGIAASAAPSTAKFPVLHNAG